jgi:hypothetical protein
MTGEHGDRGRVKNGTIQKKNKRTRQKTGVRRALRDTGQEEG